MKIIAENRAGFVLLATREEVAMITGNSPASPIGKEGDDIQIGAIYGQLISLKEGEAALANAKQTLLDAAENLDPVIAIIEAVTDGPG